MKQRLYLTLSEIKRMIRSTRGARNALRDQCMILMGFLHGLRISELTGLRLVDIDLSGGTIYIRRLKNGFSSIHPLQPEEIKLLSTWLPLRPISPDGEEGWLFQGAKGKRISRQQAYKLIRRYGELSGLSIQVHPHMLRHACGYELAEQGLDTRLIQDYLGHRNIRHTVHYTAGNARRFSKAWVNYNISVVNEVFINAA